VLVCDVAIWAHAAIAHNIAAWNIRLLLRFMANLFPGRQPSQPADMQQNRIRIAPLQHCVVG
jgi:hypothetical protein